MFLTHACYKGCLRKKKRPGPRDREPGLAEAANSYRLHFVAVLLGGYGSKGSENPVGLVGSAGGEE